MPSEATEAFVCVPYARIEVIWDSIRKAVVGGLPRTAPYEISQRIAELTELATLLADGVVPGELGIWPKTTPAPLEDILNAGWVRKCVLREGLDTIPDMTTLFRLVLKAVESSSIHEHYGPRLTALEEKK